MALKAWLCTAFLLGDLCSVMAAPTFGSTHCLKATTPLSKYFCLRPENVNQIEERIPLPLTARDTDARTFSTTLRRREDNQYLLSFSNITSSVSNPTTGPTMTVTIIVDEPTTITVLAEPKTITEFITVTPSSSSSSVPQPAPSRPPADVGMGPAKAVWAAPATFSDLSSFQVSKFASGKKNLEIVIGIPAKAGATSKAAVEAAADPSLTQWDNESAALQLFYPEGSINPANEPKGGAEFYATPLDISDARSVTLRYSAYFPADFDWVLGGKMPGLYGGHAGCSGGNAALDCFSTRLMWRKDGAGELYLYAPKDKQTKNLCDDPQSVCDAVYGLSVGRGSFSWIAGSWTTVQQTLYLNTPGKQDGRFALDVNGVRVIDRSDIFYRDNLGGGSGNDRNPTTTKTTHASRKTSSKKHTKSTSSDDGGLLEPILSKLLGGIIGRDGSGDMVARAGTTTTATRTCQKEVLLPEPTPSDPQPQATTTAKDDLINVRSEGETEVKLVGIFFSTFFGGHEDRYATPRDQYAWFKDFALTYNE